MAGGGGGGGDGGGGAGAGGGGGGGAKRVPMRRLFTFADRLDAALMAVGGVAAVANGVAMPFLAFLIGELVDAFGAADRAHVVHVVSKVSARDLSLSLSLSLSSCAHFVQSLYFLWGIDRFHSHSSGLILVLGPLVSGVFLFFLSRGFIKGFGIRTFLLQVFGNRDLINGETKLAGGTRRTN